jgi:peptide deformylase
MTVRKLVPSTDPFLREVMPEFDFENQTLSATEIARDLAETMISENGLGLSACQIGIPVRAFAMLANPIIVCFNPRIVDQSIEQIELEEGCLSFPGLTLNISRSARIRIRFKLPNGETETFVYDGMTARVVQHEMDHLNGILFTDHVSKLKVDIARRKARKIGS